MLFVIFFFKQKTAYEMRISDWSSDVCSSDLFTRRAFLNDRMDLAQAEAVADLIDASSVAAARGAMASLSGEFSARVNALSARIVHLRLLVEATLAFPEEEIDFLEKYQTRPPLEHHIGRASFGGRVCDDVLMSVDTVSKKT